MQTTVVYHIFSQAASRMVANRWTGRGESTPIPCVASSLRCACTISFPAIQRSCSSRVLAHQVGSYDIVPNDYPGASVLLITVQGTPAPCSPGRRESPSTSGPFSHIIRLVHLHACIAGYGPSILLKNQGKESGALAGNRLTRCFGASRHVADEKLMRQRFYFSALAVLAMLMLAACSASLATNPGSGNPTIALHPIQNLTPSPTAPPFTIGAFASNETPNVNDSITIYVIFHINGKPQGGATVNLNFHYDNGIPIAQLNSQAGARTTGDDGWAAFPITFTGLTAQKPVIIDITITFNGQTYVPIQNIPAFFTPVAPTPAASPTVGAGG